MYSLSLCISMYAAPVLRLINNKGEVGLATAEQQLRRDTHIDSLSIHVCPHI